MRKDSVRKDNYGGILAPTPHPKLKSLSIGHVLVLSLGVLVERVEILQSKVKLLRGCM